MNDQMEKIKVGISSCLLGEKVRFDSGHKKNAFINSMLADYFDFTGFCPEVDIGLGIPRETIRLVEIEDSVRCVGTKTPDMDVTDRLYESAEKKKRWHQGLCGYILKKDSPSCGMERVKVYKGDMPGRKGIGIYAERLMQNFPSLPVEEEGRLEDSRLRENFIQRVYIYWRWQTMVDDGLSLKALQTFHAQHKYIFMSHDQNLARPLGAMLATKEAATKDQALFNQLALNYLEQMMTLLKKVATRNNHVNTLHHIQGYLKNYLSADDKQELTDIIHQYREGLLPLIVPITLLRHHFRRNPDKYIANSYYMQPHPGELMLLNNL